MSFVSGHQKTAVFISGGGSCLQGLLELSEFHDIKLVIAHKKNISGTLKARRYGIDVVTMTPQVGFDQIHQVLQQRGVQKIFLAGFMKIIPESFLSLWKDKIFNIHPSLLPQFKGLHAFEAAYESNSDIGVTIHHVIPEMDAGETVLQMMSTEKKSENTIEEAHIFLRCTEQHLIREYIYKGASLCTRF